MTKYRILAVLLLCAIVLAAGCQDAPGEIQTPPSTASNAPQASPKPTPSPTSAPTPDPVQVAMDAMSAEEKVGQLLVAGIEGKEPGEDARAAVEEFHAGGIILFGRNVESVGQLTELNNGLKALAGDGVPLFLCVDEEGGRVSRMPPELANLPAACRYGQIQDEQARLEACYRLGQALAAECAAFGFSMDFAPSLDIWSNPDNTVIGDRAFGSDAGTVTQCGPLTARGLTSGGVVPVVKHFPGHGDTAVDSHVGLPQVDKSLEELLELELAPFASAIAGETEQASGGVPAVMVAHILMKQLDPDLPASLSPAVVTGLLRERLGFAGVVCTDDLTMGAISNTYGMGEAAVLAVEAGCDLLLVCHGTENLEEAYTALLEAVGSGRISQTRLDESVRRILSLKETYGVDSEPVETPDVEALNALLTSARP